MKTLSHPAALSLALFLASCSFTQQTVADAPPDTATAEASPAGAEKAKSPAPTDEQQQAAERLLSQTDEAATATVPAESEAQPTSAPAATEEAPIPPPAAEPTTPTLPGGGLRMGSIIPQEDPASTGDAPAPTANSAERFGLRSPKMPSKLPMGIDGKIQPAP